MIKHIAPLLPAKIETYYEPFIGGAAVFFELAKQKRFERAVIGDCNAELVNVYVVVKSDVDALIKELQTGNYIYKKTNYYRVRALETGKLSKVERAARIIYLNHTCFNGLYRVNLSGQFNVPFGKYKNPAICDEPNLRATAKILEHVHILNSDFTHTVSGATKGDVVYMDPPYIPVSDTSKFTAYNKTGFTEEDHRRLATCFKQLVGSGVCCILSNSHAPLAIELYGQYDMLKLMGSRVVGGPASYRKPAKEIIVTSNLATA